jgi:hypothetical protein
MIEYEIHTRGSCAKIEDVPSGATILEADGKEVIARCEACGKPITTGADWKCDAEGMEFCIHCWNEMLAAEPVE